VHAGHGREKRVKKGIALLNGAPVKPGDILRSNRGEEWAYISVTRLPEGASTGRVYMGRECGHVKEDGECVDAHWCKGVWRQEFFPSVFPGIEIRVEG
jgi:hypothetical protein